MTIEESTIELPEGAVLITDTTLTGYVSAKHWRDLQAFQRPVDGVDAHAQDAAAWLIERPDEPYEAEGGIPPEAHGIVEAMRAKLALNPNRSVLWDFTLLTPDGERVRVIAMAYGCDKFKWRRVLLA